MAPTTANTIAGKVGNVYVVPYGTTAPFTVPPSGTFDITAATLTTTWQNGNLGYLHEDDTPAFSFDLKTQPIISWQTVGNPIRILQTGKARSVKFTVREVNRNVWGLIEPGSTYTAGANGSDTVTVPNSATNADKAALFEVQDLDFNMKMWIYIPKINVTAIGDLKFDRQDTANVQLTFNFLSPTGLTTDPLYYVASNHPGLQ